jgi:hypothetical protein
MTDACRRRNIDLQLTADERRHAQTFLPADPAGKKHVNRYAIKKFQSYLILIWYLKILWFQIYEINIKLYAQRACSFSLLRSSKEKILSAQVCVRLRLKKYK